MRKISIGLRKTWQGWQLLLLKWWNLLASSLKSSRGKQKPLLQQVLRVISLQSFKTSQMWQKMKLLTVFVSSVISLSTLTSAKTQLWLFSLLRSTLKLQLPNTVKMTMLLTLLLTASVSSATFCPKTNSLLSLLLQPKLLRKRPWSLMHLMMTTWSLPRTLLVHLPSFATHTWMAQFWLLLILCRFSIGCHSAQTRMSQWQLTDYSWIKLKLKDR